jgi:transposase
MRAPIKTTEVRQMRAWRKEGHSIKDIAAWSGRHKKTVLRHIRDIPPSHVEAPKIDKALLFHLLDEGVSIREIARRFDCHVSRVYQLVAQGKDGGGVAAPRV